MTKKMIMDYRRPLALGFWSTPGMVDRNWRIKELRDMGWTLKMIGDEFSMSKENVRKILHRRKRDDDQICLLNKPT